MLKDRERSRSPAATALQTASGSKGGGYSDPVHYGGKGSDGSKGDGYSGSDQYSSKGKGGACISDTGMMMLRRRHQQQVDEIKQQKLEIARLESENAQLKHQIASIREAALQTLRETETTVVTTAAAASSTADLLGDFAACFEP